VSYLNLCFGPQQHDAKQDHYIELRKNNEIGALILSSTLNIFVRGNSGDYENDGMIGSLGDDIEDIISYDDDMLGCLLL
jgi:hypothetical protein